MAKFTTIMSARSDLDWCWFLRRQGVDGDRIERVMHDIGVLQPGGWAHWQGGTQTPSGALASVICATRDRILRVTTEVANPGGNRHWHLEKARQTAENLAPRRIPDSFFAAARRAQSGARLRFGARLQLNAREGRVCPTLIAEWPTNARNAQLPDAGLTGLLQSLPFAARITQAAFHAGDGEICATLRTSEPLADVLPKLCAVADVPQAPLQQTIAALQAPGSRPIGSDFGFSLTTRGAGLRPELTLHLPVAALSRNETGLAEVLRPRLGGAQGTYATLMDMHLPSASSPHHHGPISLTARSAGAPHLSVDVAAPWACPLAPIASFRTEAALAHDF